MSSFRKPHTLYREAGSMVDGKWVVSGETEIAITASIQPATGKDLANLDEGMRHRGVVAVYSSTEMRTATQSTATTPGTRADQIVRGGVRYECVHAEDWDNDVINHDRALFARID